MRGTWIATTKNDTTTMDRDLDALTECQDCALRQQLPSVPSGASAACERCGAILRQVRRFSLIQASSCAGIGLALFGLALWLPVASVALPSGRFSTVDVFSGLHFLTEAGAPELSAVVVLTLLLIPPFRLSAVLAMACCVCFGRAPGWVRKAFTVVPALRTWAMVDVFLLGALIALLRLSISMHVSFGPALFALAGAALCSLAMDATLDHWEFWRRVPLREPALAHVAGMDTIGCRHCGTLSASREGAPCPRCERKLAVRRHASVSRTWALMMGAATLLVPANVLPAMTTTKLGRGEPLTIIEGVVELEEHGLWGVAAIVFVTSITIPILKLVTLLVLLVMIRRGTDFHLPLCTRAFRFLHTIVRWSMTEVFTVMVLVSLVRFVGFTSVLPGPGASAYCAVVFLTMWAADSFDPRVMWAAVGSGARWRSEGARRGASLA